MDNNNMGNSKLQLFYQGDNIRVPKSFYTYQGVVSLDSKDWKEAERLDLITKIDEWRVMRELKMHKLNQRCLKSISHIKFPFLMLLNVSNSRIYSLEVLSKMWMPTLETIDLRQNYICELKSLRKIESKRQRRIFLQQNQIKAANDLDKGSSCIYITVDCDLNMVNNVKNGTRIRENDHRSLMNQHFHKIMVRLTNNF